jgi:hypothetical protein
MAEFIVETPPFWLCFAALFKPTSFNIGGPSMPPKYRLTGLFDEEAHLVELNRECARLLAERFGDGATAPHWPIKPADPTGQRAWEKYTRLNASSPQRPLLRDRSGPRLRVAEKDSLHNGCLCTAEIVPYTYDTRGYRGVGLAVLSVTKVGEPRMTPDEAAAYALEAIAPAFSPEDVPQQRGE